MQRSRIAVAAAVVAAAGAAVAFTLPSMAGTTPSAEDVETAGSGVAPQLLAAMRRDLGLDSEEATARIKRAEWASGVTARLSALTGADYGGAWLADDGTTLKVAVTDPDAVGAVRAAGAVPVLVKRSQQTLTKAKTDLDEAADDVDGLSGWYVDVPTNKVVVLAEPGETDEARKLAEDAGIPSSALTVKVSSASPRLLADVRGADPYFFQVDGGTARCSIGFAVEGGFVTAGHCGVEGTETLDANQQAQGVVQASVFPGNADMGFVATNNDANPRPVVNDFKGNELPVGGNTEAPVGAAICRSGSTTGTFCGRILTKNQTVVYPEGAVTGLTRTDVCAEGGDSGGPWLVGDQAQGMTSGGSGDCREGGETFFQPVNEILAAENLTLLTTGDNGGGDNGGGDNGGGDNGGNGGGEGSASGVCADESVQIQGELGQDGGAEAQPRDGSFTTNAGEQSACLDVSDGADFDFALQQLTNRGFRTVASATGNGDKTLTFNGTSGVYRYVVVASSGAGTYTLGFTTP